MPTRIRQHCAVNILQAQPGSAPYVHLLLAALVLTSNTTACTVTLLTCLPSFLCTLALQVSWCFGPGELLTLSLLQVQSCLPSVGSHVLGGPAQGCSQAVNASACLSSSVTQCLRFTQR